MHQIIGPICHKHNNTKRSIIIVNKQPFYRSSGRNSGKPGIWLPFDGITYAACGMWYSKERYAPRWFDELHRYGTQELKDISDWLGTQSIPEGEIFECPKKINNWINNKYSQQFNELLEYLEKDK